MRPCIIFTNFFDANHIIKDGYFNLTPKKEEVCCVFLKSFEVYSIALGMPNSNIIPILYQNNIKRLDCFCPTYTILKKYKEDQDWESYRTEYRQILRYRKEAISEWIATLSDDMIYILCCWENTSKGANCHRRLLYDAFRATSIWKDKAAWIYRHGSEKTFSMESINLHKIVSKPLEPVPDFWDTSIFAYYSTPNAFQFLNNSFGDTKTFNLATSAIFKETKETKETKDE